MEPLISANFDDNSSSGDEVARNSDFFDRLSICDREYHVPPAVHSNDMLLNISSQNSGDNKC
jgi:hypothetical protein